MTVATSYAEGVGYVERAVADMIAGEYGFEPPADGLLVRASRTMDSLPWRPDQPWIGDFPMFEAGDDVPDRIAHAVVITANALKDVGTGPAASTRMPSSLSAGSVSLTFETRVVRGDDERSSSLGLPDVRAYRVLRDMLLGEVAGQGVVSSSVLIQSASLLDAVYDRGDDA